MHSTLISIVTVSLLLVSCSDASDESAASAACAPAGKSSWDSDIGPLFIAQCGTCHPSSAPSDYNKFAVVQSELTAVMGSIVANRMPKGAPLSAADKAILDAWVKAGAPQSMCK